MLVRLAELQGAQKVSNKNFEFRKRLREPKAAQQAKSLKLRLAVIVLTAAWIFAGIRCFG